MMAKIERRFVSRELRVSQEGHALEGYAALYNSQSVDLGWFREIIKKGAFDRALKEKQDVRALKNHDPNMVLGRSKSSTLALSSDDKGLAFRIDLPDTSYANDLHASVKRGDMDQCSFGFSVPDGGARWTNTRETPDYAQQPEEKDGSDMCMIRELHDVDLSDISVVTYPAYEETSASARSIELRALWPNGVPEELAQRQSEAERQAQAQVKEKREKAEADAGASDADDSERARLRLEIAKRL